MIHHKAGKGNTISKLLISRIDKLIIFDYMFVLSKVLLFLLFPITWVLAFMVYAIITKKPRRKQRLLIISLIVFYIFSAPVILDNYARLWDYPPVDAAKLPKYSCAIVLGGFSSEKRDSTGMFNGASDRFIQGLKLKAMGKASHILITSGNGSLDPDGFSEGDWVYTQLKQLNIPDSVILIENKSRNTIENALFTKRLLVQKHLPPPYLLVTSAFHMRRSQLIFKKAGLETVPYPCNYTAGFGKFSIFAFWPSTEIFNTWGYYTKELVGYVVAWLRKF
ncbi:YdcF family protein [Mucilaginibacter agri]|uniref:DUF218 domain-containing protein n=1 Tax=Mucilaginibacter agri TaxID=2695265 RepID=A0A965ZHH4_9SPHI|nr:YdcF family protein [Mucilaginibacter agri]NCD70064.1 hypothetical protein [Mucilaginibacter agri]